MKLLDKIKFATAIKYFKKNKKQHHYETLAPTSDSDSKETINMLSDFLANKENINIALSGKYGERAKRADTPVAVTLLHQYLTRLPHSIVSDTCGGG